MYTPNSHSNVSLYGQHGRLFGAGSESRGHILPVTAAPTAQPGEQKYNMLLFNMMYYSSRGSSLCLQAVLMYFWNELEATTFGRFSKFQLNVK